MNSSGMCSESSLRSSAVPIAGKSFRIYKVLPLRTLPVSHNRKNNILWLLVVVHHQLTHHFVTPSVGAACSVDGSWKEWEVRQRVKKFVLLPYVYGNYRPCWRKWL